MNIEIPPEEIERVKTNLLHQKIMSKLLSETPEFIEQNRLFRLWLVLGNIPSDTRCPICGKGYLAFSCGHGEVEGGAVLIKKMITIHGEETRAARIRIEQEHPELEIVPFFRGKTLRGEEEKRSCSDCDYYVTVGGHEGCPLKTCSFEPINHGEEAAKK